MRFRRDFSAISLAGAGPRAGRQVRFHKDQNQLSLALDGRDGVPGKPAGIGAPAWVGRTAERRVAITAEPLDQFAVLSGDTSAIHMGERAAADAGFPGRGTYGMLLDAMISGMVGTELPGNDGLLQQAKFAFRAPCHPGDEIVIHLKVTDYFESVQALLMDVKVSKVGGLTLLTGQIQSGVRG